MTDSHQQHPWVLSNQWWLKNTQTKWSPSVEEAFQLRVWFSSPIAWSRDGIQIDGYLQRLVVERETGELSDCVFSEAPRDYDANIQIPIKHVVMGGYSIACASWGWPPWIAVESLRWRRRRTRVDTLGLDKVLLAGGPYKSTNIPLATLSTPFLDFYLIGDQQKVRDLLDDAVGLGRGYSAGYGAILGIEYFPDEERRALVWGDRPMRSLPLGEGCPSLHAEYLIDHKPARAPYWAMRNVTLCAIPDIQVSS